MLIGLYLKGWAVCRSLHAGHENTYVSVTAPASLRSAGGRAWETGRASRVADATALRATRGVDAVPKDSGSPSAAPGR